MARMPKSTLLYWPARVEQENRKGAQRTVEQMEDELRRLYKDQSEKLFQEIADVFMKMERDQEEKGKTYLNDLYRTSAYNELLQHFNSCAKELGAGQLEITERYLIRAYEQAKATVDKYIPDNIPLNTFSVPSAVDARQVIHHT